MPPGEAEDHDAPDEFAQQAVHVGPEREEFVVELFAQGLRGAVGFAAGVVDEPP